jgi:hypothetical protein
MLHDSGSSEPNMNQDTHKPVPPLTAKTKGGKTYTRFADVEAEIRNVWYRPPLDWIALKGKLKNETLVFLICKGGVEDDYIRGELLAELNVRKDNITESLLKKRFDPVLREEISLDVESQIFNLVWLDGKSAQAQFLEIAFAKKVRELTSNAAKRYAHTVMGEREQLDVSIGLEKGKGAFAVVELTHDLIDVRRDPEEILLLLEDEDRRNELFTAIHDAVKDDRHFQALYLFHAEDKSLSEIAAHFNTTVRNIRYWKSTAMHQIRVAFGIENEEKRDALNKLRRARREMRLTESRTIRPSSRPTSIAI